MLTLTRRIGETITIGPDIEITVVSLSRGRVRLSVSAPRSMAIHRRELVERVSEENRLALARVVEESVRAGAEIHFAGGLPGLREHDSFVLCELGEGNPIRCLVSCRDPQVQLHVVDAEASWPDYPAELARAQHPHEEETAVGLIVRVPADGSPPTVNLAAPLVIGLETRSGRQVLLEREDLPMAAPLTARKAG
ncbi:MAG: carbon storage regulator [Myxococcales bacterium]|nr:carbon storage regulator [Myxococcales bacterium]